MTGGHSNPSFETFVLLYHFNLSPGGFLTQLPANGNPRSYLFPGVCFKRMVRLIILCMRLMVRDLKSCDVPAMIESTTHPLSQGQPARTVTVGCMVHHQAVRATSSTTVLTCSNPWPSLNNNPRSSIFLGRRLGLRLGNSNALVNPCICIISGEG